MDLIFTFLFYCMYYTNMLLLNNPLLMQKKEGIQWPAVTGLLPSYNNAFLGLQVRHHSEKGLHLRKWEKWFSVSELWHFLKESYMMKWIIFISLFCHQIPTFRGSLANSMWYNHVNYQREKQIFQFNVKERCMNIFWSINGRSIQFFFFKWANTTHENWCVTCVTRDTSIL